MTDRKDDKDDGTPPSESDSGAPGPWQSRDDDKSNDAGATGDNAADATADTIEAEYVDTDPGQTAPTDAAPKSAGPGRWLLAVVIAFLIGAATWPLLEPRLPADWIGRAADPTAALTARLATLEDAVAAAPTRRGPDPAMADLRDRVARLDEMMAALGQRVDTLAAMPAGNLDANVVDARIAALAGQLDAIAARPPVTVNSAGDVDLGPLAARLDDLEIRLAAFGEGNGASDEISGLRTVGLELEGRIETLTARLAEIEATVGATAPGDRRDAFVLALTQLRAAVERGDPYAQQLTTAERLADGVGDAATGAPLAALGQWAGHGVPTLRQLRDRFVGQAGDIVATARRNPDADWVERTVERLTSAVTVRRIGNADGDTVDAVVARAERHLAVGDLSAAVGELAALDGNGGTAAAPWLADARVHLDAMAALDGLQERAIALLGGG